MADMTNQMSEIDEFLGQWPESSAAMGRVFGDLHTFLAELSKVSLTFIARPGVTYSLRALHGSQVVRPLFAMVDVIDDNPRWLSVCFYAEMVSDPEERGTLIPGGLLGEDGRCFDVEAESHELLDYIKARVGEAHRSAAADQAGG